MGPVVCMDTRKAPAILIEDFSLSRPRKTHTTPNRDGFELQRASLTSLIASSLHFYEVYYCYK